MSRLVIVFAFSIFIAPSVVKAEERCRNATPAKVAEAEARMAADPAAKKIPADGYVIFQIDRDDAVIYNYFTTESHPAHPSNVIEAVYESGGRLWVYAKGFTAGNCQEFERWLQAFSERQDELKRSFAERRAQVVLPPNNSLKADGPVGPPP